MGYAEKTAVSADRSQAEIRSTLARYGASHFAFGEAPDRAVIGFRAHGRSVRFELPTPSPDDDRFWKPKPREHGRTEYGLRNGKTGYWRLPSRAAQEWDQEIRRLWRALALAIKAKLEVVESGISTFEDEFLAHIVLPDNRTVGEHVSPMIEQAYETGHVRALLPEFSGQ